jgi:hypothetical protein
MGTSDERDDGHYWDRELPITRVTVHTKLPGEDIEEIISGTVMNIRPRVLRALQEEQPTKIMRVTPQNKLIEDLLIPLSQIHIEEAELVRDQKEPEQLDIAI